MFLLKLWSMDLNVTWWRLIEQQGVVILRPTWRVAGARLFVTFLCWLISAGWVGVEYELRDMVERRRFDAAQLEDMEQRARAEGDSLRRAGKPEEAAEIERSMRAFTANMVREREEKIAQTEAWQRPARMLLIGMAAAGFFMGLMSPLSVLWQRVRIACEGPDLVVRITGLMPRRRRVSAEAALAPEPVTRRQLLYVEPGPVENYARGVRYRDRERAIIFWVRATDAPSESVQEGPALAEAIKRLAGQG